MKRSVALAGAFFALAPAAVAQAPASYRLRVDDSVSLPAATLRCFAKSAAELICGGSNSRIYVRLTRHDVYVMKTVAQSSVFKLLYHVKR